MVSTGWGAPSAFSKGFDPSQVAEKYCSSLYIWDWQKREVTQELALGGEGLIPLEVRFLHNPAAPHAFVGAALSSNVIHVSRTAPPAPGAGGPGTWAAAPVIRQPWLKVEGWVLPEGRGHDHHDDQGSLLYNVTAARSSCEAPSQRRQTRHWRSRTD